MKKSPLVKYIIISTAVFLLAICFLRHDNLIRWIHAGFTVHRQERQIEWYKSEIADLDKQIEALDSNIDTLETYARETFHFAEPGDDVYLLDSEK